MALDPKTVARPDIPVRDEKPVTAPDKQTAAPSKPANGMVRLMNVASGQLVDMTEGHAKQFVDSPYWRVIG